MATKKLKEKNSFMMYHTWVNQFNMLPPEEFVNMVNNLYRCDKGEEPILNTQMEKVIWEGMGFVVEANKEKWEARAAASRANGAQGGAPVKATPEQLNLLNNLDNPVGYSNNLDNQAGFSNNLDNLIKVTGEMENDNGELEMDKSKLENENGEKLVVSSRMVNEKGELVSDTGKVINEDDDIDKKFAEYFPEY